MGCWWVPSPALRTGTLIHPAWASRWAAPQARWRMTTASAPMAMIVWAVSFRDSPLETLEPLAEKLMTSALRRLAAASKDRRVRVESSKKRLTTVLPRRVGSFLTAWRWVAAMASAVSRTMTASSWVRSLALSRCLIGWPPGGRWRAGW